MPPPSGVALQRAAATSLLHALDPVAFAREALHFDPDPWQSDLLTRMAGGETKRAILTCSRQSGKSTTAAALAVHVAVHRPGSLVLLVAPTLRQSTELFAKVGAFLRMLPSVKLQQDAITAARLGNGSRVVSLPGDGNAIRGYSAPALVIVDESAFVAEVDGLWPAIMPMLAVSNGSLLLASTPNGRVGFHYDIACGDDEGWHRVRVPWTECSRISPAFIEEQTRTHGPRYVDCEFNCIFTDATNQYFSDAAIDTLIDPTLQRLHLVF